MPSSAGCTTNTFESEFSASTGITYPLIWVSVIFGLIQACVAVIGFGSLKVLARVALPIKVVVLTYLFVLFARHDDPNFELAKVRRSRGGVSFGWTPQSESHTLVYLNHDNAFVALPN